MSLFLFSGNDFQKEQKFLFFIPLSGARFHFTIFISIIANHPSYWGVREFIRTSGPVILAR